MAELKKVNDFHYEAPEMDQPTVATEQDRKMQEETLPVPTLLPKKKLKNVSLLEKLIGVVLVCATIGILGEIYYVNEWAMFVGFFILFFLYVYSITRAWRITRWVRRMKRRAKRLKKA